MKKSVKNTFLRGGSALEALALLGAGVVATAIFAAPAAAQDYTNINASGRVVSTDGSPIANATVEIVSDAQGFTRTVTTNSAGTYRIAQIPPGSYTVTISAPGFDTYVEAGVVLSQGQTANQYALLPEGAGANAEIVVTAGRIKVADFDQTTTGAAINVADLASRTPIARDLTSILQLAPGVTGGDSAFGNLASAVGSSVAENVFYINGLNITEFREGLGAVTVPFDFYETVEVKNGGYQAEFGRATGAFVNATTKSGSNTYHGSIKFNWEPNSLRSKSPNTYYADNDFAKSDRLETIAELSGPIIKDHLFFYGLYNFRDVQSQAGTTTPVYAPGTNNLVGVQGTTSRFDRTRSPFYGGKIDAVIVDGQRLEFTYFNTSGTTRRDIFGNPSTIPYDNANNDPGPYNATQIFEYGGENWVGRYTGQFTNWLTISAAYGQNRNRDNQVSSRDDYPFIRDQRFGSNTAIGNPVNQILLQEDKREFYRGDIDIYFDMLGSHHIKAGFDRENLTSNNVALYTGGVAYTYTRAGAADPFGVAQGVDYVTRRTYVNGGVFHSTNEAYYIQDNWSLFDDRLSLKLGLRNDRFKNENVAGDVYYDSGDNWQPRLGFTVDPVGDGRSKVYGSFGRYYLPIATNTNIRLGGAELDYDELFYLNGLNSDNTPILGGPVTAASCAGVNISGNNCTLRTTGDVHETETVVSQNLKNQSVDEFIIGGEHRFGNGWRVGIFGTYRKLNESLEDGAIDQAILTYCDQNGIVDCGGGDFFGANQYALFNPGSSVTITPAAPLDGSFEPITLTPELLGYPAAKRTYKAVTLEFEREFDGVWGLQGSYTYSKNRGNIEGGVKSDNAQTDSGLTTDFDFPSLTLGSYGNLPNDRRHQFKLLGSWKPTDWLVLGGNLQVTSPRYFGCLGQVASSISSPALIRAGQSYDYGYAYGAEGRFCVLDSSGNVVTDPALAGDRSMVPRGSMFKSNWLTTFDFDVAFRLPTDMFESSLRLSVFNVLNAKSKLDFMELGTSDAGTPRADYRQVTRYQSPRTVRIQFTVGF